MKLYLGVDLHKKSCWVTAMNAAGQVLESRQLSTERRGLLKPVRKALVAKPEDWRWSSYNNFAIEKATVQIARFKLITCFCRKGIGPDRSKSPRSAKPAAAGPWLPAPQRKPTISLAPWFLLARIV